MSNMRNVALSFCRAVAENPSINNSDARIGAWIIGAAERTGGFPMELTYRDICKGFTRNDVTVEGLGSRYETIRAALDSLEGLGLLTLEEGKDVGFGYTSKLYTMHKV